MIKFLYAFLFFVLAYASEKTEVRLRSEVQIGSAIPLTLEDLVEGDQISADLLNIEVPFVTSSISREDFLSWLKNSKTERRELSSYSFKIPETIKIEKLALFSREQVSRRAQSRLRQRCQDCEFRVQLTNLPQVSGDKNKIEWRELPLSGPFMVSVTNNEGQNLAWISGQIKTERSVVKANRVLRAGDTLQADDLRMEKSDVSYIKDYYTDPQQILGRKVNRAISASSTISSVDIQRNYDVKQGQIVRVVAGNETFEIVSQAVAQDSGVVGDTVRVRNVVNQKIVSGRVLDKGLVRVE